MGFWNFPKSLEKVCWNNCMEESSMWSMKSHWLTQRTANIWGSALAPWPSLRCLTSEPCCLQCETRCTSLMKLLCGFGGVITGKVLRTLAQVDTWIPCIRGYIELAYRHSSVGNHPKPQEKEKPKWAFSGWSRSMCCPHPCSCPGFYHFLSLYHMSSSYSYSLDPSHLSCFISQRHHSSLCWRKGQPFHIVLSEFLQIPHQHAKLFYLVVYFFNVCEVLRTAPGL